MRRWSSGSGSLALRLLREGRLAHSRDEESLVDSTVEDGHTQFDALGDDIPSLETCFAG
jgi:hypothetical protein